MFVLMLFTAVLFFIWPIPHTVTIREFFLVGTFLLSVVFLYRKKTALVPFRKIEIPFIFYFLFLAWITFVAVFVSDNTHWALREIKSQWFWGTLALVSGGMLGHIFKEYFKPSFILTVFFVCLLVHVMAINADGLGSVLRAGGLDRLTYTTRLTAGLTIGPIDASVLCDFLLIIVFAEWMNRKVNGKEAIFISDDVLIVSLILSLAGSLFCGLRNIVELSALLVFISVTFFARCYGWRSLLYPLLITAFLAIFLYRTDSRWTEIGKSIELAGLTDYNWNIEYKHPTIEPLKGTIVNASNYLRFEKYQKSMYAIVENPFGVGYGRNAFGHGMQKIYDKATGLNADSSFFDIFIGAGVIGGVLWLCFYVWLFCETHKTFKKDRNFASYCLLLLLTGFGARMAIDSIFRDHLMQQFLFMAGFLYQNRYQDKNAIRGNGCGE